MYIHLPHCGNDMGSASHMWVGGTEREVLIVVTYSVFLLLRPI